MGQEALRAGGIREALVARGAKAVVPAVMGTMAARADLGVAQAAQAGLAAVLQDIDPGYLNHPRT